MVQFPDSARCAAFGTRNAGAKMLITNDLNGTSHFDSALGMSMPQTPELKRLLSKACRDALMFGDFERRAALLTRYLLNEYAIFWSEHTFVTFRDFFDDNFDRMMDGFKARGEGAQE